MLVRGGGIRGMFISYSDEFRNRLRHYDVMTNIVSGLVNLRILGKLTNI